MLVWDYVCQKEDCDLFEVVEERFVKMATQDSQVCSCCQSPMKRLIAPVVSWSSSKERTKAQLKTRSEQHMKDCLKKGQHPDDTRSGKGTPEWRNKMRSKNRKKGVVEALGSAWKTWEAGSTLQTTKAKD